MARATAYVGENPDVLGGRDNIRSFIDPDSEIVTHVSRNALGCRLSPRSEGAWSDDADAELITT